MICFISGLETMRKYKGVPVHKEVLEFARMYRDAKTSPLKEMKLRGILIAFETMKKNGYEWEGIKKKLIKELENKNLKYKD